MPKVVRDIIRIDEALCDGCGDCISKCAEGALEIVNGKARLKTEKYCDGAGACLGHCPTGALTIERREVEAYDELAVAANLEQAKVTHIQRAPLSMGAHTPGPRPAAHQSGCPGSSMRQWSPQSVPTAVLASTPQPSSLRQWPVQLMLVSPQAPYFRNADLLLAADCVPFAHAGFHSEMLTGKALAIACPKLDNLPFYVEKLTQIFQLNELKSLEVVLMEVPCCGGLAQAAMTARANAGADFPVTVTVVSICGDILQRKEVA